jgi:hypothetical protein
MTRNAKRKLDYAFNPDEIEFSTPKKLCVIPFVLSVPPPILHTKTYQTDFWRIILSNFHIQQINKESNTILDDIKIILTLSETCQYFKYYFDMSRISTLLNMFWIPDIFEDFHDCCQFFAFWSDTKKYGWLTYVKIENYLLSLNLRRQYYLIRLIKEIHSMIHVKSYHNISQTKTNYPNYFQCCEPKEVIEKKWMHLMKLIPDQMKRFPKTKIIRV